MGGCPFLAASFYSLDFGYVVPTPCAVFTFIFNYILSKIHAVALEKPPPMEKWTKIEFG